MWFGLVTLFPEMFDAIKVGVTGKAIENGKVSMQVFNPRDFAHDKFRTVDDKPYGGGPGMVMMAPPLLEAIRAAKVAAPEGTPVVYLSPQGQVLKQSDVCTLSQLPGLILIAGRYEGIDQRVIDAEVDVEWSVGDYILSGGELPAMVMMDSIIRTLPGVLGDSESVVQDSLSRDLLKYPQYTRPVEIENRKVPPVLLSGNHQAIEKWRNEARVTVTKDKRPDLYQKGLTYLSRGDEKNV